MQLEIDRSNFLPHQYDFLISQSSILGLVAGFGAGKTHGFLRKVLINHLFNKRINDGKSNGWIIYPTLDLANELFVEDFKDLLDGIGVDFDWNIAKNRLKSRYGNMRIYTLEQPNRMVGANLTYVGIDEFDTVKKEKSLKCFRKAIGRLRGNDTAQLFIVTTPEGFKATHSIFVENPKPGQQIIHAKTTDNPYLPESYLKLLQQQYDPVLLKAYMLGQFVNLESGAVYYAFDRHKHVNEEEIKLNPDLPVNICFDFNVYPFCTSWNQELNDQNIVFIDEWVSKRHSNTAEACDAIISKIPSDFDVVIFGDASGRNNAANSNVTNYQIIDTKFKNHFKSVRYCVPSANPAVKDRINCVNNKFWQGHVKINKTCINLIQDLEQVVWNEKGNELDKSDIKRTHSTDGLGYYVTYKFPIANLRNELKSKSFGI